MESRGLTFKFGRTCAVRAEEGSTLVVSGNGRSVVWVALMVAPSGNKTEVAIGVRECVSVVDVGVTK